MLQKKKAPEQTNAPAVQGNRFTPEELKKVHDALVAATLNANFVERVISALHDPGVSVPPNN